MFPLKLNITKYVYVNYMFRFVRRDNINIFALLYTRKNGIRIIIINIINQMCFHLFTSKKIFFFLVV